MEELQKLEGTVEHLIFENRDTGYAVFEVSSGGAEVIVAGVVGEICIGESIVAYGRMETHPNYGEQFKAQSCQASLPQDLSATQAYLASGALPYIGPATAKKIIKKFGADTLDIIADNPIRLTEIKGLSEEKAQTISQEFRRMFGVKEVVAWMSQFGIPARQAVESYRFFGSAAVEILTHNPYLLCGEPLHLKFRQADVIAAQLQLGQDHELRIYAAILYALRHNASNGHTCLPRDQLIKATAKFIALEPDLIEQKLDGLIERDEVGSRTQDAVEYIFLPDLLRAEENIAARLVELTKFPPREPKNLAENIRVLEYAQGFAYAQKQREAIETALRSNVFVLTGGPGTGKTTTVDAILALLEGETARVSLCAPTGRAAKRLSELTGHKASTIHRLLEVDYSGGVVRFVHNEKNLLKCDVVILDEMSMVDVKLFQALLLALRHGCRILMVGDADQLPSVGPGNILGEVIRSGVVPTVCLTEIFRQAEASRIVTNAHLVSQGQMPQKSGKDGDFFMLEAGGMACQQLVCDLVCRRLPAGYGLDSVRDIQVLCPTKLGPVGTVQLNRELQAQLNPPGPGKSQLEAAGKVFRVGDKVMQIRNNYDIPYQREDGEAGVGAFNGDIGIVAEVNVRDRVLKVKMDDRLLTYAPEHLPELDIAYAVTVHKSQGSEFMAVVVPAAEVPAKLCYRNLFYTAITRARRLCIVAGNRSTVASMVQNVRQNLRFSCLCGLLRAEAAQ